MTWFAVSANETEAAKAHYHMFVAVDFDFSSAHTRLWSGVGNITILGNTYIGMGHMASVSSAPEMSNLTVDRKIYRLSGTEVNPAIVSEADLEASFGRSVTEYFGFMNVDTGALLADPEVNFEGEISNIRRVDGPEPMIEVNAEHRLILLDQPDGWRYTHEHQQSFYAGDNGFDQVPYVELKQIYWGGGVVQPGLRGGAREQQEIQ